MRDNLRPLAHPHKACLREGPPSATWVTTPHDREDYLFCNLALGSGCEIFPTDLARQGILMLATQNMRFAPLADSFFAPPVLEVSHGPSECADSPMDCHAYEYWNSWTNSFASPVMEPGLRHKTFLPNPPDRKTHRESQGLPPVRFMSASQHRPALPVIAVSVATDPREPFTDTPTVH